MPVSSCSQWRTVFGLLFVLALAGATPAHGQHRLAVQPVNALAGLDSRYFVRAVREVERTAAQKNVTHPLLPIVRYAFSRYRSMSAELKDYRCRLVKRERIDGRLQAHQFMALKIRHQPIAGEEGNSNLGVYLRFLAPSKIKGREVLYVEGENSGQLFATKGGHGVLRHFTMSTLPSSRQAMQGNLYPLTQIGVINLARRLIEDGIEHMQADVLRECIVQDRTGAMIDDRPCRYIEVTFPVQRSGIRIHKAQIFIDEALEIPVRYASYSWPKAEGEEPPLLEEYTYTQLALNPGFAESDFRRDNPAYHFHVREKN